VHIELVSREKQMTNQNTVQIIESKTKRGATIKVAVIPAEVIGGEYQGLVFTGRHNDASRVAVEHGCTHYRVTLSGDVVMSGKAWSDAAHGSFGPQG
jgi:hypothetical protein